MVVVGGSVSAHEIVHEILPVAQHPVYASIRGPPIAVFGLTPFEHPHIQITKQIASFDPQSGHITLADGSVLDGVDYVIFGTSYNFSIPFLPHVQDRIKRANRRLPGVYQHTFDIEDPSLAFIGFVRKYSALSPSTLFSKSLEEIFSESLAVEHPLFFCSIV